MELSIKSLSKTSMQRIQRFETPLIPSSSTSRCLMRLDSRQPPACLHQTSPSALGPMQITAILFFKLYEEKSGIEGDFDVRTVGQIDAAKGLRRKRDGEDLHFPTVFLNKGPLVTVPFRPVAVLETEIKNSPELEKFKAECIAELKDSPEFKKFKADCIAELLRMNPSRNISTKMSRSTAMPMRAMKR